MTNCVNCGAILRGNVCEYCGTEYKNNGISANFSANDYMGIMKLGNEEIKVYISSMESQFVGGDSQRNAQGIMCRNKPKTKRKFTMVEI